MLACFLAGHATQAIRDPARHDAGGVAETPPPTGWPGLFAPALSSLPPSSALSQVCLVCLAEPGGVVPRYETACGTCVSGRTTGWLNVGIVGSAQPSIVDGAGRVRQTLWAIAAGPSRVREQSRVRVPRQRAWKQVAGQVRVPRESVHNLWLSKSAESKTADGQ